MSNDEIRERVLQLFSRQRVRPDAAFDEDHFLDFFLKNPAEQKGITTNSFTGLRRRNQFIQDVEMEFLVCFGNKDFDRNFSLQRFVDRVAELQSSPRSSHGALKARLNGRSGLGAVIIIDIVLLGIAFAVRTLWWLAILLLLLAAGASLWAGSAILGSWRHDRELARRLSFTPRSKPWKSEGEPATSTNAG